METRSRSIRVLAAGIALASSLVLAAATVSCGGRDGPLGGEVLPPAQLALTSTAPGEIEVRQLLPALTVAVQDAQGRTVTTATHAVTIELDANPGGGTLLGTRTVSAANGVATFQDLALDKTGTGYTLVARAPGLTQATSDAFDVRFPLVAVSAGDLHSCGLTASGAAYCWGSNVYGQLGDANAGTDGEVPVPVAGGLTFRSVSAGGFHSCGVTEAGAAHCWGHNAEGQLGSGEQGIDSDVPVPVAGDLTFDQVSTGSIHSCGVTTDGVATCWGGNDDGQLGDGNRGTDSDVPTPVAGDLTFAAVDAGAGHSCGVTTATTRAGGGEAYCWGSNGVGQLGKGDAGPASGVPVPVSTPVSFRDVSAGSLHACGVTPDGALYCWGANDEGQLGNGDAGTDRHAPMPVAGDLSFLAASAGRLHTCGVTETDALFCWGSDEEGQLGNGGTEPYRDVPVPVAGDLSFLAASAGRLHTCGVTPAEEAYCWGNGQNGRLGDGGGGTRSATPIQVSDP